MKYKRLTQSDRSAIIDSIMAEFEANYFKNTPFLNHHAVTTAIEKEHNLVMVELWKRKYGKHEEKLRALPSCLLSVSQFRVSTPEPRQMFNLYDKKYPGNNDNSIDLLIENEEANTLFKRRNELKDIGLVFIKERHSFKMDVCGVVNNVLSNTALLNVWPEIEEHIKKIERVDLNLPAVNVAGLNKKLKGAL